MKFGKNLRETISRKKFQTVFCFFNYLDSLWKHTRLLFREFDIGDTHQITFYLIAVS